MSNKYDLKLGQSTLIQCRDCKRKTNHNLVFCSHTSGDAADMYSDNWYQITQVYMCLGCNSSSLVILSGLDCERDPETGDYCYSEVIYPDPYETRVELKNSHLIPDTVADVYREAVKAINTKLFILGAIGIGAVLEAVCADKKISGSNLKAKVDSLAAQGFITKDGAKILHVVRSVRNLSAHELKKFELNQLEICVDVVESLLQNIYILPKVVSSIQD